MLKEQSTRSLEPSITHGSQPVGRPRAVIDQSSFPHLVDAIVASAPRASLLQLRLTSKAFRDRVDCELASHILLTAGTPPALLGRYGRLPCLRRRGSGLKGCEPVFKGARIVDIVGLVGPYPKSPVISRLNALGCIETVRIRHPPGGHLSGICAIKAPTIVIFTTITERESDTDGPPAAADMCYLPRGIRRAVINVRYDPNRPWLAQAVIGEIGVPPPDCSEVVFIFTEKATHREPQVGGGLWPAKTPMGLLGTVVSIVAFTARHHPALRYTLVDVHRLRPEWLGINDDGMPGQVERQFMIAVDAYGLKDDSFTQATPPSNPSSAPLSRSTSVERNNGTSQQAGNSVGHNNVRFMSRQEYQKHIGETAFALETVE